MKKKIAVFLTALLFSAFLMPVLSISSSATNFSAEIDCKSAVLMEASTGTILYEKNKDDAYPPASVTKIMTLLLLMESIDSGRIALSDTVTVSERAASMGGSQVYLEVGETMSVEELLKCVIISSANDACVALAEFVAGSEESFVNMMNERAAELGMEHSHFENTNGLDDTVENHLTSAYDIALMSRSLLCHEKILEYSGIWMDSIRNGAFVLTNTNRLIRFYPGANGLKTGSTAKAGYCISATAKHDDMQLICVVMGAPTRDTRNAIAKSLLDYGFANYGVYHYTEDAPMTCRVLGGKAESLSLTADEYSAVLDKGKVRSVTVTKNLPECVKAPIHAGEEIGEIVFCVEEVEIGRTKVHAAADVEKMNYLHFFLKLLQKFCGLWYKSAE